MKKEYILTQEQKDDKRRKIEENRQKKSEQLKRKKTLELDNYDPEANQQQYERELIASQEKRDWNVITKSWAFFRSKKNPFFRSI